jgi:uncharacterized protein (TIGR02145 family)
MKKQLTRTTKLRLLALSLFLLWAIGGFAQVSVSNETTDYSTKQISFTVTWTSQPRNDQIWVIADYVKIEGATTVGSWSRALVTSVSASGNGSAATVTGQRGFWLNVSAASGSANITATLSLADGVDKFNWCAYALDYPPKAVINPAGGYELQGAPPFTVNGTKLGDNVKTFGAGTCITSLSDATNNPTSVLPDPPAITLTSANSSQTVTAGSAITQIMYTTANATSATPSNLPTGVSGAWAANTYTVSGTPTSSGTFNYTVTTTNSNGCANASATGTITVNASGITYTGCTTASLPLGTVGFTSSTTYSRYGLTISSPVTVTYCNGRTYANFDGGSSGAYKADCATNYYSTAYGNWFSWCMVAQYADLLCPGEWRVPTREDYCQLVNGSSTNCNMLSSTFDNVVGSAYAGYAYSGSFSDGGSYGYYWTSTAHTSDFAYTLYFNDSQTFPQYHVTRYNGYPLRCVRDAQ